MASITVDTYDGNGNIIATRQVTVPPEVANRTALEGAARQALADNRAFIANGAPTNVQVVAQVKALSQQMNGVIRLLLGQLDATN